MKSLKTKSLRKGIVAATEVKDRMGRTLLPSGQTITAQNLKTLKAWGITDVKKRTQGSQSKFRGKWEKEGKLKHLQPLLKNRKPCLNILTEGTPR